MGRLEDATLWSPTSVREGSFFLTVLRVLPCGVFYPTLSPSLSSWDIARLLSDQLFRDLICPAGRSKLLTVSRNGPLVQAQGDRSSVTPQEGSRSRRDRLLQIA